MLFTHDTTMNLEFAAALLDTSAGASPSGADELTTVAQLESLIDRWRFSGRRDRDTRELEGVRAARARLAGLWGIDRDAAVDHVNAILEDARAVPRLVRHDGIDWHIHATSPEAPLAERILVEAALAVLDVIRADEMRRLRHCEADDCEGAFVDLSKNASRRFCSVQCGNRMAVRAYRARRAAD